MTQDLFQNADGAALLAAFERLAARAEAEDAPSPEAQAAVVLEAAALGVALAVLGIADRAPVRSRIVARARRTLLGAAALRDAAAADEDALDALDLAIEQARHGVRLLGGTPPDLASLDGPPTHEPTPTEVARLLRGELDGHAAADVAVRLHRSGARHRYAAFLPAARASRPVRLAADSAPVVRDPSLGRSLGTGALGAAALEAFVFAEPSVVIAIYAEPALGQPAPALALVSADVPLASRAAETSGYLELTLVGVPSRVTLVLTDGERTTSLELTL
jgi:hypothetical protein